MMVSLCRHISLLLVVLVVALAASSVYGDPCADGQYEFLLSPCVGAVRSKLYYPTIEGCEPPANIYDIPCECDAGQERNDVAGCTDCIKGSFNVGGLHFGGASWGDEWNKTSNPALGVTLSCEGEKCSMWHPEEGGDALVSGSTDSDVTTTARLSMVFEFERETGNEIKFQYKVDPGSCSTFCDYYFSNCHYTCNGLHFKVDGKVVLPNVARQDTWQVFEYPRTEEEKETFKKGVHTLTWEYIRSDPVPDTEQAYIQYITLIGAAAEGCDSEEEVGCQACPKGTFAAADASTECEPCGWFEFQDEENKDSCKSCPANQYASRGASQCEDLPECSDEDYYVLKANCHLVDDTLMYDTVVKNITIVADGAEHVLCDYSNLVIPTNEENVGECSCPLGQKFTDANDGTCEYCPSGSYQDGTFSSSSCKPCDAGSIAVPAQMYDSFNVDPVKCGSADKNVLPFCSECSGDCLPDQNGWYGRGDYLSTGRTIGDVDVLLNWDDIEVTDNAEMKVRCEVQCYLENQKREASIDDCQLTFVISNATDSNIAEFKCTEGSSSLARSGYFHDQKFRFPEAGTFSIAASFKHRDRARVNVFEAKIHSISIEGASVGGAVECKRCRRGQKSVNGETCVDCGIGMEGSNPIDDQCHVCPDGTFNRDPAGECFSCEDGTVIFDDQNRAIGCQPGSCLFTGESGAQYDLSSLGSDGGSMVLAGSTPAWSQGGIHVFWVNVCYLQHSGLDCIDANNNTLPYMSCQATAEDVYDIGSVMSFREVSETESELDLTGGEYCPTARRDRYTTIHFTCDLSAGIGAPELYGFIIETSVCHYELKWRTEHACRICKDEDFETVTGICLNSQRDILFVRKTDITPCTGSRPTASEACTPPSLSDYPNPGEAFIIADTTTLNENVNTFSSLLSKTLENVKPDSIAVLQVIPSEGESTVTFRITVKNETEIIDKVKEQLPDAMASAGLGDPINVQVKLPYTPPKEDGVSIKKPVAIALASLIVLLIIIAAFMFWRNRKLKYQNYQLVNAKAMPGELYSDEPGDQQTDFSGVRFTNQQANDSFDSDAEEGNWN